MKLKIYQRFHNKVTFEQCSKDPRVIKLCTGFGNKGHIGLEGDFALANEGKYTQEITAQYPGYYYAYHHITDEEYIGFSQYAHIGRQKTNMPIEDVFKLDLGKIFKEYHIAVFHPWANFIDHTNKHCPGMIDFILKWMKEDIGISEKDKEGIIKYGREKEMLYRENFILPVDEYREYFLFLTRFIEWIDRNYGINEYKLNIRTPRLEIAWGPFNERAINFYLLNKYREKVKVKAI